MPYKESDSFGCIFGLKARIQRTLVVGVCQASNKVLLSAISLLSSCYKSNQIKIKPDTMFTYAADIKAKTKFK